MTIAHVNKLELFDGLKERKGVDAGVIIITSHEVKLFQTIKKSILHFLPYLISDLHCRKKAIKCYDKSVRATAAHRKSFSCNWRFSDSRCSLIECTKMLSSRHRLYKRWDFYTSGSTWIRFHQLFIISDRDGIFSSEEMKFWWFPWIICTRELFRANHDPATCRKFYLTFRRAFWGFNRGDGWRWLKIVQITLSEIKFRAIIDNVNMWFVVETIDLLCRFAINGKENYETNEWIIGIPPIKVEFHWTKW